MGGHRLSLMRALRELVISPPLGRGDLYVNSAKKKTFNNIKISYSTYFMASKYRHRSFHLHSFDSDR